MAAKTRPPTLAEQSNGKLRKLINSISKFDIFSSWALYKPDCKKEYCESLKLYLPELSFLGIATEITDAINATSMPNRTDFLRPKLKKRLSVMIVHQQFS